MKIRMEARGWPTFAPYDDSWCERGIAFDFTTGDLVKLAADGTVRRAAHGSKMLSASEIGARYGQVEWHGFEALGQRRKHSSFLYFQTYFDMPAQHLLAQMVEAVDEHTAPGPSEEPQSSASAGAGGANAASPFAPEDHGDGIEPAYSQLLGPLLDAFDFVFDNVNALESRRSLFMRELTDNPGAYLHPRPELRRLLLELRAAGKRVFLATNSESTYADLILRASLGPGWRSCFDLVTVGSQKPGFFASVRPFRPLDQHGRFGAAPAGSLELLQPASSDATLETTGGRVAVQEAFRTRGVPGGHTAFSWGAKSSKRRKRGGCVPVGHTAASWGGELADGPVSEPLGAVARGPTAGIYAEGNAAAIQTLADTMAFGASNPGSNTAVAGDKRANVGSVALGLDEHGHVVAGAVLPPQRDQISLRAATSAGAGGEGAPTAAHDVNDEAVAAVAVHEDPVSASVLDATGLPGDQPGGLRAVEEDEAGTSVVVLAGRPEAEAPVDSSLFAGRQHVPVLYCGDHLHGDVVAPSEHMGWQTVLVLEELEHQSPCAGQLDRSWVHSEVATHQDAATGCVGGERWGGVFECGDDSGDATHFAACVQQHATFVASDLGVLSILPR